jgi:uncharacterized protein
MRILIDIGHPGQVYFFRNFISRATTSGHEVKVTARDKEVTLALLSAFNISYDKRGEIQSGLGRKALGILSIDQWLYSAAKRFKPDILIGFHNPYITHVSKLIRKPSIIFTDTEGVWSASCVTYPFADAICTPACFLEKVDPRKHVRFNGYKELAYLHPDYFSPNHDIIRSAGFSEEEPLIVLRLISWSACHDGGLQGIRKGSELNFIKSLEEYGRVVITSEKGLPPSLERYKIAIPPQYIHSLLTMAQMYIGEGGTMAAEAAILGTPAIHIEKDKNGKPTGESSGNFRELRDTYGLLKFFATQDEALDEAKYLLKNRQCKQEWQRKREILLKDKIDVTSWMIDFIENYPESHYRYRESQTSE